MVRTGGRDESRSAVVPETADPYRNSTECGYGGAAGGPDRSGRNDDNDAQQFRSIENEWTRRFPRPSSWRLGSYRYGSRIWSRAPSHFRGAAPAIGFTGPPAREFWHRVPDHERTHAVGRGGFSSVPATTLD